MRKPLIRIAAALFGGMLALLIVAPIGVAFADTTARDVKSLDEAWFFRYRQPLEPVPDIDDPTGNNPDDIGKSTVRDRTNPYPVDTFHVGVNSGQLEALMYMNWDTYTLNTANGGTAGFEATITGGTVTFTDAGVTCASTAPESAPEPARQPRSCGSRNAQAAKMVACRATELVVEAQGGDFRDKYKYDAKDCTPLVPVKGATDPLQWTAKLDQFADTWKDPFKSFGIAVVPAPDQIAGEEPTEPQSTWHVAFHGRRTDVKDVKVTTADLKIKPQVLKIPDFPEFGAPLPPAPVAPSSGGTSTFTPGTTTTTPDTTSFESGTSGTTDPGFTTSTGTSTVIPDTSAPVAPVAEAPPAAAPPVAPPVAAVAPTQPVNASAPVTPAAIWLLPILGLSLAGALGWSLSQPVELATEREGAVSKLMKARRFGGGASA